MLKLIHTNFYKLRKSKAFWLSAGFMALYAVFICLYCKFNHERFTETPMNMLLFAGYGIEGLLPVPGIVMAAFCAIFVGTEYSDGTMRNKLIVGHSRFEIYMSNFLICAFTGVIFNLTYIIFLCAIGFPMWGGFTIETKLLVQVMIAGLFMMIAYAAVYNMLAMLISSKSISAVVSLLMVIAVMCLAVFIIIRLREPEITDLYEFINGEITSHKGPNPMYIGGMKRVVCQFIVDILPTGQCLQLSARTIIYILPLILYAIGMTAVANIAGIVLFYKKDLK